MRAVNTILLFVLFIAHAKASAQPKDLANWNVHAVAGMQVYTPPGLRHNEYYTIALSRPKKLGGKSHGAWLQQYAARDERNLGKILSRQPVRESDAGVLTTARRYRAGRTGATRYAIYLSLQLDKDKAGLIRVNYSSIDLFKRYGYALKQLGNKMAGQGNRSYLKRRSTAQQKKPSRGVAAKSERRQAESRPDSKAQNKRDNAALRALWTAPNQGLKPSQVEAVTYHMDYHITGFGPERTYEIYLLLKDGWAYESPTIPPTSFNVAASRKLQPPRWHRWRKHGKVYQIRADKEWREIEGVSITPAKPGQTLDADLYFISSWNVMGVGGGSSRKRIKLTRNGRFESSFSAVNMGSDGQGGSVVAYGTADKGGSSSGASGTAGYGTRSRSRAGGSDRAGTYKLNGYTLELRHDSGKVSQLLFGFTFGGPEHIFIDGVNYQNEKYKK